MTAALALARKESRALAGTWLAAAAGIVAGELPGLHTFRAYKIVAYFLGAAALGSMSFGHEYGCRMLSSLLVQPIPRARILAVKSVVLGLFLLALAALALVIPFADFRWHGPNRGVIIAMAVLPVFYGIAVAPWLTISTRSAIAGAVFTLTLPALLVITGERWAYALYGAGLEGEALKLSVLLTGSVALVGAGAAGLWRSVLSLEVVDGPGTAIRLPAVLRLRRQERLSLRRAQPFWLLITKELRLQQLVFGVSALYVAGYVYASLGLLNIPADVVLLPITVLHAVAVATLIGSLASAEERALGTAEWQLVQPMSARAQFAIKLAVVFALTLLLAFGLPALLASVARGMPMGWPPDHRVASVTMALAAASGSLYVSTIATTGLTALILCVPLFLTAKAFVSFVADSVAGRVLIHLYRLPGGGFGGRLHPVPESVSLAVFVAFVLFLLGFAFVNHRDAERSATRPVRQLGLLAVLIAATVTVFAALGRPL